MRVRSRSSFPRRSPHTVPERFSGSFPVPYRPLLQFFPRTSPISGPRRPFTMPVSSSTRMRLRQQTVPPFSQLTTASLSPPLIPALSRISFGRTSCPRSSTDTSDSTLHAPIPVGGQQEPSFSFFFISVSPLVPFQALHIFQHFQHILIYLNILNAFVNLFFRSREGGKRCRRVSDRSPVCRAGRSSSRWRGRSCA